VSLTAEPLTPVTIAISDTASGTHTIPVTVVVPVAQWSTGVAVAVAAAGELPFSGSVTHAVVAAPGSDSAFWGAAAVTRAIGWSGAGGGGSGSLCREGPGIVVRCVAGWRQL
jgi:hypothetical protein